LKTAAAVLKQPAAPKAAVTHPNNFNTVDPYRRIKGEEH
jgi:hypothetical protein